MSIYTSQIKLAPIIPNLHQFKFSITAKSMLKLISQVFQSYYAIAIIYKLNQKLVLLITAPAKQQKTRECRFGQLHNDNACTNISVVHVANCRGYQCWVVAIKDHEVYSQCIVKLLH